MARGGFAVAVTVALVLVASCSGDDGDEDPARLLEAEVSSEANYDVTGPPSCPLRDVTFTDESIGDPETWRWEFSDGSTSDEQHPVVSNAVHEATLTVTRGEEKDSVTHPVDIVQC